jgi:hypothetical protein
MTKNNALIPRSLSFSLPNATTVRGATIYGVFRQSWWKRLWDRLRGIKPGVLFSTHVFPDGEATVKNGETLTVKYTLSAATEPPPRRRLFSRWSLRRAANQSITD